MDYNILICKYYVKTLGKSTLGKWKFDRSKMYDLKTMMNSKRLLEFEKKPGNKIPVSKALDSGNRWVFNVENRWVL